MGHSRRRLRAALTLASATLLGLAAFAAPADASTQQPAAPATSQPLTPNFDGIVALSNCSGAIVRWKSSKPRDKALMLTNGHCTKFYGAHEVAVNQPLVRAVKLLKKDGSDLASINTTTLLYGTMDRTDVSLYEMGLSFAQLRSKYGVHPLTVSRHPASANAEVQIISGFFKRAFRCHLNGFVYHLQEADWTWHHSLRYNENGCHTIHGTSGSPVVDAGSRTVVGINNTGNDNGQKCTLNNPCEVDRHGHITVHLYRHYGQQTWWFTTCLGTDRQLHLNKAGCMLSKP